MTENRNIVIMLYDKFDKANLICTYTWILTLQTLLVFIHLLSLSTVNVCY